MSGLRAIPRGPGLAILVGASACADPRSQAAGELVRLNDAIQAHASRYGRLPESVDPAQPESVANLPFRPGRGVQVRLNGVAAGRYAATASQGIWLCWASAGRGERVVPDCAPTAGHADARPGPPPPLAPTAGAADSAAARSAAP